MGFRNAAALFVCSLLMNALLSLGGTDSSLAAQKKTATKSKTTKVANSEKKSPPKSTSKKTNKTTRSNTGRSKSTGAKSDRAVRMEKQEKEKSRARISKAKSKSKSAQRLPRHFAKLDLSEKQRKEVYAVQSRHAAKLKKLRADLEKARSDLDAENRSVLTKTQIKTLDKLRNGKGNLSK